LSENSRTDVHDGDRTGRSSTSGTVVNAARGEELIFENRPIVIPDLIGALRLSIGRRHYPRKKGVGLDRVKILNSCSDGTKASAFSRNTMKNNDTSVEHVRCIERYIDLHLIFMSGGIVFIAHLSK
jgi:hypothetical protein